MQTINNYILLFLLIFSLACSPEKVKINLDGLWIGEIHMQGKETPFKMEITEKEDNELTATIINGKERIVLDEIERKNDSLHITLHIFDVSLDLAILNNALAGTYTKHYEEDYVLPVTLHQGDEKFILVDTDVAPADFSGKWDVTFVEEETGDTTQAVGIFEQDGHQVSGTFLTPLGDYRYLTGLADNKTLKLSTFDGNHAFLFEATMQPDSTLSGDFYSGKEWHETWTAFRSEEAELPDPDSLTYLKKGYDQFGFSFPNLQGENVSLSDDKYEDKVVIVQIFGTWCPNCMDETRFLADWYEQNKKRGVEIIGLAYEQKDDFEYAKRRVKKMKEKLNVPYDLLIAGTSDKEEASKTLPMLNEVISFPTMIILNEEKNVVSIHTGFSGPGTGKYYEEFKEDFNRKMDRLLATKE